QVSQIAGRYNLDLAKMVVMGHSAGGQLALCLTGHEASVKRVISLAGVVDLQQAWELHLSDNAVVDFLGGEPRSVPEHYREADPMQLKISQATQWLIHGAADDTVPPFLSRNYTEQKKKHSENVHYLEISTAGHFDLIDPRSPAWAKVEGTLLHLLEL
ncbi:MAG TPA: prolyl oligopeptidase family serine peptidase, partial [Terriglobales bacterium]|nr:prolyl oligopeptidase family serine peptidase [Terriglobales bacterium]